MTQKGFAQLLILIGVLVLIGGVSSYYFYFQKLSHFPSISNQINDTTINPKPSQLLPTSTPSAILNQTDNSHLIVNRPSLDLKTSELKVANGSVYLVNGSKEELFIDKNANTNYNQLNDYDIEFDDAEFSPTKSKISLLVNDGYSFPSLFLLDVNNLQNSNEFGPANQLTWSPNGKYLAATTGGGDCGPQNSRLFYIDTQTNQSNSFGNLKKNSTLSNITYDTLLFTNIKWLADSTGLNVDYTALNAGGCAGESKTIKKGTLLLQITQNN